MTFVATTKVNDDVAAFCDIERNYKTVVRTIKVNGEGVPSVTVGGTTYLTADGAAFGDSGRNYQSDRGRLCLQRQWRETPQ